MDDAGAVRLVERVGDLDRRSASACSSGSGTFLQPRCERLALEMLHDEKRGAVMLADVVERADMRMVERRDGARFAFEAGARIRVGRRIAAAEF